MAENYGTKEYPEWHGTCDHCGERLVYCGDSRFGYEADQHADNNDCIQHLHWTIEDLKEKLETIEKKVNRKW